VQVSVAHLRSNDSQFQSPGCNCVPAEKGAQVVCNSRIDLSAQRSITVTIHGNPRPDDLVTMRQ
jgi:hypothetical protein